MFLADPGDGITTSANDLGMMHGFTVTLKLSIFCFIFQLLNTLKECLLSFLTITILMFNIVKVFLKLRRGNYHPITSIWSPALNNHLESIDETAGNVVFCSCISVTLFGATTTRHLHFLPKKMISPIGRYETLLIARGITKYALFVQQLMNLFYSSGYCPEQWCPVRARFSPSHL